MMLMITIDNNSIKTNFLNGIQKIFSYILFLRVFKIKVQNQISNIYQKIHINIYLRKIIGAQSLFDLLLI